jgi:hypothetical protein
MEAYSESCRPVVVSGLIVFSGPTGCGKSTTIYSILNEFDPLQHNIQTAESPIEVVMPHVNQVEISDFGRNTFLNWVRGIVREAPDILMMYAQSESTSSMPSHRKLSTRPSRTQTDSGNEFRKQKIRLPPLKGKGCERCA